MKLQDIARKLNAIRAEDEVGTNCVKVLLYGQEFTCLGISTLADKDGNRLTEQNFNYLGRLSCGLFRVRVPSGKFGYIGTDGQFAIPPIYDDADDFSEDVAWAERDGKLFILSKTGEETSPEPLPDGEFVTVEPFVNGFSRVSTVDMHVASVIPRLAYPHDDAKNAGVWGYVDKTGKLIVAPRYIFAVDFCSRGYAFVCAGEWVVDEELADKYNVDLYWSKTMKWGAIDSTGREVVPCQFRNIKWRPSPYIDWERDRFPITRKYLAAQDDSGKWGLIDYEGNWAVQPQFAEIGCLEQTSPNGDMFVFYAREINYDDDQEEVPCGVYSISKQAVLIPADKYLSIEFLSNTKVEATERSDLGGCVTISLSKRRR